MNAPTAIQPAQPRQGTIAHWRADLIHTIRSAYVAAMPRHRLHRYIGDAADIFTFTTVDERLLLFDEATAAILQEDSTGKFLEIGSFLGASAAVLAEALKREADGGKARLFCIDTWHNDAMTEGKRDTFARFLENTRQWERLIQPIRASSHEAPLPQPALFDLVFIDGDHSFDAALADIRRFAPTVAPHGRLLLHDHCSKPGVARALGVLLTEGQWAIHRVAGSLVSLRRARW